MSEPTRAPRGDGLRSEELRRALDDAAQRRPSRLAELLARHSGLPGPRPNVALAQAFGDELARRKAQEALAVLAPLAEDDAAHDTAQVFLPMAAAFGYAALLRADVAVSEAWSRLAVLGADERAPVRLAVGHALAGFAARTPGGGDRLVQAMGEWLGDGGAGLDDRDVRWGALATALDAIAERGALTTITERASLLEICSRWITELVEAPRAAERSDARRRSFASLSVAAALFAKDLHGSADGAGWLEGELSRARHPDLRRALGASLERLRKRGASERVEILRRFDSALASSAKPPRDPTLERKGTRRRGQP